MYCHCMYCHGHVYSLSVCFFFLLIPKVNSVSHHGGEASLPLELFLMGKAESAASSSIL